MDKNSKYWTSNEPGIFTTSRLCGAFLSTIEYVNDYKYFPNDRYEFNYSDDAWTVKDKGTTVELFYKDTPILHYDISDDGSEYELDCNLSAELLASAYKEYGPLYDMEKEDLISQVYRTFGNKMSKPLKNELDVEVMHEDDGGCCCGGDSGAVTSGDFAGHTPEHCVKVTDVGGVTDKLSDGGPDRVKKYDKKKSKKSFSENAFADAREIASINAMNAIGDIITKAELEDIENSDILKKRTDKLYANKKIGNTFIEEVIKGLGCKSWTKDQKITENETGYKAFLHFKEFITMENDDIEKFLEKCAENVPCLIEYLERPADDVIIAYFK